MGLSRRHAIAGVAVALAGCAELQGQVEKRADGVLTDDDHPLKGTTTIGIVDRSDSEHDLEALTVDAAAFWTDHAAEYADVGVSFRPEPEGPPDVEVVFLDSRTELAGCEEHASSDILGCAPLLTAEHRPERPITVEVVVANRPAGDVRITVQHELGHTLGLDHDDEPAYIMSTDIADRLPEYGRRREVLESFENAWAGRNSGTQEYNRAVNRWNDGEYDAAAPIFERSAKRYRTTNAWVERGLELARGFDGMERPETVDRDRLRDAFESAGGWTDLAAERSELMALSSEARADGDVPGARELRAEAEEVFSELQAIDFPAPIEIASALGLLRDGKS
ncbi:MAG: hypothetical protein ACQET5_09915 [Halobacteriota archaeon]